MLELQSNPEPQALEGRDIVCISASEWDQNWLSNHQYMSRLAERNRVLYVERPRNLIAAGKQGISSLSKTNRIRSRVRPVATSGQSLLVATPPPVFPMRFEAPVIHANQYMLRRWLRRVIAEHGFRDFILWSYSPDACFLHGNLGEAVGVYSITDDHASYKGSRNRESSMRKWEQRLIEKVDVVFATAENLVELKRKHNPNCFYAPHGVDAELFANSMSAETLPTEQLGSCQKPIVGFIGLLNCRIDVQLIQACAAKRPDWNFVLIGPQEPEFDSRLFASSPNVIVLGRCDRLDVPRYLKQFDVGFIPYIVDEHTRYLHPLKVLEYLAAGLPVVSTNLPAIKQYGGQVAVGKSVDETIHQLSAAMNQDGEKSKAMRQRFAMNQTWSCRLQSMNQHILDAMERTP
jgi:glycosyltransferase involved in cell wall biosynthesis